MTDRYCYQHSVKLQYAVSMKAADGQRSAIQVAQECPVCRHELGFLVEFSDSSVGRNLLPIEVVQQFLKSKLEK